MADHRLHQLLDRLDTVAPGLVVDRPEDDPAIVGIAVDSRRVGAGTLFCARRGTSVDAHDFAASAVASGAVAALVERAVDAEVPQVVVSDSHRATALAAAWFEGDPSAAIDVVGITGTNGKTTIVSLLEHVANHAGVSARSLGTLHGVLTTADSLDFQRSLADAVRDGVRLVAAEVSSHALDQRRVDGTHFRVVVFTNLTQDHLDYHPDMEHYFAAKARLFEPELAELGVIDVSDPWGARLAAECEIDVVEVDGAALAGAARLEAVGSTFVWRTHTIRLPLVGRFNVVNAVLVAETAAALGLDEGRIVEALQAAPQVPGRFEYVDQGQPFGVVVDYSHTPASLTEAIATAAEVTDGRVLAVFGSAGDRDPGKRPLMGAAASAADIVIVTSDNPRSEDPDEIIDEVVAGITADGFHREADRGRAIRLAVSLAEPGDLIVIAGKGHENYQIVGDEIRDFDDRVEARAALADAGWEHVA